MKATCQWDSAGTSCLSEMPILRAMAANTVLPKPRTPGPLVSEVPPAGAMSTAPQIFDGLPCGVHSIRLICLLPPQFENR